MQILIKKPYITEKSMKLAGSGLYSFLVDKDATKKAVAKLVANRFGVDVLSVKTANIKSKTKIQRTRRGFYQTQAFKKAWVQVKKGQKIAIFESAVAPGEEEVQLTTTEGEALTTVKEKKSLLRGTKVKIEKKPSAVSHQQSADKKTKEDK